MMNGLLVAEAGGRVAGRSTYPARGGEAEHVHRPRRPVAPSALDLDVTHALERALGPEGKHRFFREHQLASFQSPLFRALVDSATAIFGLDPGSWARWIPRGWGIVFRDCGQWVVDRTDPGEVDLALLAPPPGCLDDEIWLRSLASSFSAFLVVAKTEGEFAFVRVDRARAAALYTLRWTPG